jgi:polyhydroxyalkanoate synthase
VRFVLGGSGHIAGSVNPPAANKYGYWTNEKFAVSPQDWLGHATQHPGSWWNDWAQWIAHYAGDKTAAREPGTGRLKAIEEAPGSYVMVKIDSPKVTA